MSKRIVLSENCRIVGVTEHPIRGTSSAFAELDLVFEMPRGVSDSARIPLPTLEVSESLDDEDIRNKYRLVLERID